MEKFACVKDYENFGKKMLAPPTFNYINGVEKLHDSDEYNSIQLKLRGLANISKFVNPLHTTILGEKVFSPVGIAPFPHQAVVHKEAEIASAKAAQAANQFFVLST